LHRMPGAAGLQLWWKLPSVEQGKLAGIDPIADLELRTCIVAQSFQVDRGDPLLVRFRDWVKLSDGPVESDREAPSVIVVDRAIHPNDTADVGEQSLGMRLGEAGAEDRQLDRAPRRAKCTPERCGGDHLRTAIRGPEEQAVLTPSTTEVDH